MPVHPLVAQLYFTRSELLRGLEGLSEEDARKRLLPMNSIGWIVGHMANQEARWWLQRAQGKMFHPELNDLVGAGKPASTPPLAEMLALWRECTQAADLYLQTLTPELLLTHHMVDGKPLEYSVGTLLYRAIYHYWYHIGEALSIRQMLGNKPLPEYVGNMSAYLYQPD
jgi:uncharacterized damage-inducible protein DinB